MYSRCATFTVGRYLKHLTTHHKLLSGRLDHPPTHGLLRRFYELLGFSVRYRSKTSANQALPSSFEGSQDTEWPSLHRARTFLSSCYLAMLRKCLGRYKSRDSKAIYYSATSTVDSPGLTSTATVPATQFAIKVGPTPKFAAASPNGLFFGFDFALSSLATRRDIRRTWSITRYGGPRYARCQANHDRIVRFNTQTTPRYRRISML